LSPPDAANVTRELVQDRVAWWDIAIKAQADCFDFWASDLLEIKVARRERVCHTPPLHQTDLITGYANRATCVILISEFGLTVPGY